MKDVSFISHEMISWFIMFLSFSSKYVSTIEAHKGGFINKRSSFSKRMKLYFDIFHSEIIKYNFHKNFSNLQYIYISVTSYKVQQILCSLYFKLYRINEFSFFDCAHTRMTVGSISDYFYF